MATSVEEKIVDLEKDHFYDTGKVNVDRTNIDREFLLNIRLGNTTYEEIIEYADKKKVELLEAIEKCDFLPETIDYNFVNDILIKMRSWLSNYV